MSTHDAGLREQVERATDLLYLRLNEILMDRDAARQEEIDDLKQQLQTAFVEVVKLEKMVDAAQPLALRQAQRADELKASLDVANKKIVDLERKLSDRANRIAELREMIRHEYRNQG